MRPGPVSASDCSVGHADVHALFAAVERLGAPGESSQTSRLG
jgi:hypothetical protein